MSIFVLSALEYELQDMALIPSCKGIGVDLVDQTNHVQGFTPKLAATRHAKRL
jgi:hypothetical protein